MLPQLREHNQSAQQQARMGQLATRERFDSEPLEPLTQQVSRTCTRSQINVPERRRRFHDQSSSPTTRGEEDGGSSARLTRRKMVLGLPG
jgi:hypothetical protein